MGEVYRARDPRLGRTVAIKVLPAEFSADEKLRLRFEREARAISSLNHPHICSVYDIGHQDGRDYLVMEYIEGETLSQRLARGPLPTEQLLRYGIEIAESLEKAHRQGIIHRDLKPSNIMITKSGAKLLDFGLAKSRHGSIWDQAKSKVSQLPTAERPLTAEGTLVGTLEYMAPEQLEGKEADARTDIFALGGVLYRMVTGKRPFEGDSDASLIAAILEREPRPITALQPLAPAALDRVVRSCLTKDPDERIQTAHDVLLELRWVAEGVSHPSLETRPISERKSRLLPWLALAVVTVAVSAGLITWRRTTGGNEPFRPQRFELQPPEGVRVAESGAASTLAISPDGAWVAFRGVSDEPNRTGLYLRSTRELGARLVPGSVFSPFFSADSKWLGFFGDGFLQKVPVSGGEPRRICQVRQPRGASWGDDGMILFSTGEGLLRVSAEGGQPETLTKPPPGERHYWPHFLPGSKHALFVVHSGASDSWRKVAVLSLEDRKIRMLATGTSPRYVDGQLVYSHLGTLHSSRFDPEKLKLSGEPRAILDDVYFYTGSGFTGFDVSRSGSLVYVPGAERLRDAELVWVDREGRISPAIDERRNYGAATISPDGKQFAVVIRTTLEDSDLWIYETERRQWRRLTNGKWVTTPEPPVWSSDNRWIVFSSFESGHGKLFRIAADGSKAPERLTSGVEWDYPGGISARDNVLVFMRQVQAAQWDLLTLSLDGSGTPQPFLATPVLEAWPAFSPNGRWVAYESDETGTREIHVRPYPGPGQKVTISSAGGELPLWSRNGRELFYQRGKEIWAAAVSAGGVFTAGQPKRLFTADFLQSGRWQNSVDVASDGKFLMVRHPPELRPQRRLVYVPNWTAELKQTHTQSQ
jgi:serine/threonine protein kinase/Tol biopolymer transport system component